MRLNPKRKGDKLGKEKSINGPPRKRAREEGGETRLTGEGV